MSGGKTLSCPFALRLSCALNIPGIPEQVDGDVVWPRLRHAVLQIPGMHQTVRTALGSLAPL